MGAILRGSPGRVNTGCVNTGRVNTGRSGASGQGKARSSVDYPPGFPYLARKGPPRLARAGIRHEGFMTARTADEVTADDFRKAMRGMVGNCSLITVGEGARASGLVVTSAISLSIEPPLLLACVNRSSSSHPLLAAFGCFGLSSLGAAHQPVAERFSGLAGVRGAARYEGAEWETAITGARLLKGAPAAFDCRVEEMIDRATHSILIGRVLAVRATPGAGALTYWNGRYLPLDPPQT